MLDSPPGSIGLSSIVVHELYCGAHKSVKVEQNLETLRLLLADFPILGSDQANAFVSGEIRAALAAEGIYGGFRRFKGRHFDQSVILLCVRRYLAYGVVDGLGLKPVSNRGKYRQDG